RRGNADKSAGDKPYMAGRFAATDTAVGSYSAEVFSFEHDAGSQQQQKQPLVAGGRPRTNTVDSVEGARMRTTVYSGPIVSHKSGGVSVTFTSEEVRELPLVAEEEEEDEQVESMQIDELDEAGDEDADDASSAGGGGTKRTRSVMRRPPAVPSSVAVEPPIAEDVGSKSAENITETSVQPMAQHAASATDLPATVKKKKRRLLQNRADNNVALADDSDDASHSSAVLAGSWPPASPAARVAQPLVPLANKQPVMFTPVRPRARPMGEEDELSPQSPEQGDVDRPENIFMTPIKMLSRLRNRKK
ncbi:hypothetical protein LPJ73_001695, partial [Coemansia sp. RSA 2703]